MSAAKTRAWPQSTLLDMHLPSVVLGLVPPALGPQPRQAKTTRMLDSSAVKQQRADSPAATIGGYLRVAAALSTLEPDVAPPARCINLAKDAADAQGIATRFLRLRCQ